GPRIRPSSLRFSDAFQQSTAGARESGPLLARLGWMTAMFPIVDDVRYAGLDLLATAVLLLDARRHIQYANAAAENLFALSRKQDRKSTRLNSSHVSISYAVFCLKKKIEL